MEVEDTCPRDDSGRSCGGRGQCSLGFLCICQLGWAGEGCEEDACPRHCSGHGECRVGLCACHPGFAGAGCSISLAPLPPPPPPERTEPTQRPQSFVQLFLPVASLATGCPNQCSGRGRCDAGTWSTGWRPTRVCHPFQRGADCSEAVCEPGCREHGRCKRGLCVCEVRWAGRHSVWNVASCSHHSSASWPPRSPTLKSKGPWGPTDARCLANGGAGSPLTGGVFELIYIHKVVVLCNVRSFSTLAVV